MSSTLTDCVTAIQRSYILKAESAAQKQLPWWRKHIKKATARNQMSCNNESRFVWNRWHDEHYRAALAKLLGPEFKVSAGTVYIGIPDSHAHTVVEWQQ